MQLDLSRFSPAERSTLQLRVLYEGAGYRKFRCSHFEEYSLYQQNERFLSDSQVITFTDLDGKLRAIKPDVTLSIAKNAQPAAGECKKYYYTEQICRPSRESHTFSEISQMGLECIGAVGAAEQAESASCQPAQDQPFVSCADIKSRSKLRNVAVQYARHAGIQTVRLFPPVIFERVGTGTKFRPYHAGKKEGCAVVGIPGGADLHQPASVPDWFDETCCNRMRSEVRRHLFHMALRQKKARTERPG